MSDDERSDAADEEQMLARIPKKRPMKTMKLFQPPPEEVEDDDVSSTALVCSNDAQDELSSEEDSDDDSDNDSSDESKAEEEAVESDRDTDRRPKKRPRRNMFVETEAEVDDEDDEDEEEDGEFDADFIDEAGEAEALQTQIYRKVDRRREEERMDVDEIQERLAQRYANAYREYRGDVEHVPTQFLQPTTKDPNLWLVRCKPGRERDIVMNLMRKYLDYESTDHPLRIKSAVVRDTLKGYIYVEARSMGDVQQALDKMNHVYLSRIALVPLEEMTDVLTIRKRSLSVKTGSWIRSTRGKYRGDLAQVLEIAENNENVRVKIIPRLDAAVKLSDGGTKRKAQGRPPQRLFNFKEYTGAQRVRGGFQYGNDFFDRNGFLEKVMKMTAIETENVTPTLEELSRFNVNQEEEEGAFNLAALADAAADRSGDASAAQFHPGDLVSIKDGDLIHAQGIVKTIDRSSVTLRMKDDALGEIQVTPSQLQKCFQIGDHVRVVGGKFKDESGMITQVHGNIVSLFSDSTMQQFSVFLKDIQSVADVSVTENKASAYRMHDFVQLGPSSVGVVVKVERDQYKVLDQNGTVLSVKAQGITQKRDSKNAVALDANQNTIQVNDVVDILEGERKGKQGPIMHLYRTWAFIQDKDLVETGGVFVARTRMISLASAPGTKVTMTPRPSGGQQQYQAPAYNNPMQRIGATGPRRDALLNKTVMIAGGPFKGYQGIVKDLTEKGARVELHTNAKLVTVDRSKLLLPGEASTPSAVSGFDRFSRGGMTPMIGSKTPNVHGGSQTPNVYGGARTPAWDAGSKTPAWDAMGAKTPAWDASARTPAWEGARTPMPPTGFNAPAAPRDEGTNAWSAAATPAPVVSSNAASFVEPPPSVTQEGLLTIIYCLFQGGWLLEKMEVQFKSGPMSNRRGVVQSTRDRRQASVALIGSAETVSTTIDILDPVLPAKKDKCCILSGENAGEFGTVIDVDSGDAIVRLETDKDFKVIPLETLCKVAE